MHFILSPGAMIEVVNTPEIAPATASCLKFNSSSGCVCCNFFPNPNPAKLNAKMGATPMIGAGADIILKGEYNVDLWTLPL